MFSNLIKSSTTTGSQGDFWFEQTYAPVTAGPPVPPGYQLSKGDFIPTTSGVIPGMQIVNPEQLGNLAFAPYFYGSGPNGEHMLPTSVGSPAQINRSNGITVNAETQTGSNSDDGFECILKCDVGTQVNIDQKISLSHNSFGSNLDSYNEKQALGDKLFPLIEKMIIEENVTGDSESCIHLSASKITGMLLEIDVVELLHYLQYDVLLKIKFHQAVAVLKEYAIKEKFVHQPKKNKGSSESEIYPINLYPLVESLCVKKMEELDGSAFQLPKEYCPGFSLMVFQMIMKRSKEDISLMLESSEFLKACVNHAVADRQYQAVRPVVHTVTNSTRDVFQQLLENENDAESSKEEIKVTESSSSTNTKPVCDSKNQAELVNSLMQQIENLKLRHESEIETLSYQLESQEKSLFMITEEEQHMNRNRIIHLEGELKTLRENFKPPEDYRKSSDADQKPITFEWLRKKEVIAVSTDWLDCSATEDTPSMIETKESNETINENASEKNNSEVKNTMVAAGSSTVKKTPTKSNPDKVTKTPPSSKKKIKQKKRAR